MKVKKHVYHLGDYVKICNPLIYKRTGYPMSKADTIAELTHKYSEPLKFVLGVAADSLRKIYGAESYLTEVVENMEDDVLKYAAVEYMREKDFGGRDRTIHTEVKERFRGKVARVTGKRTVKTGRYCPGAAYDDGEGYESSSLRDAKSHVILEVMWEGELFDLETFQIEECHVEPYKEDTPWGKVSQEFIAAGLDSADWTGEE